MSNLRRAAIGALGQYRLMPMGGPTWSRLWTIPMPGRGASLAALGHAKLYAGC